MVHILSASMPTEPGVLILKQDVGGMGDVLESHWSSGSIFLFLLNLGLLQTAAFLVESGSCRRERPVIFLHAELPGASTVLPVVTRRSLHGWRCRAQTRKMHFFWDVF